MRTGGCLRGVPPSELRSGRRALLPPCALCGRRAGPAHSSLGLRPVLHRRFGLRRGLCRQRLFVRARLQDHHRSDQQGGPTSVHDGRGQRAARRLLLPANTPSSRRCGPRGLLRRWAVSDGDGPVLGACGRWRRRRSCRRRRRVARGLSEGPDAPIRVGTLRHRASGVFSGESHASGRAREVLSWTAWRVPLSQSASSVRCL